MKLQPNTRSDTAHLTRATLEVIQQLGDLIAAVGEHYPRQPEPGASSIGRHVRHILDHFTALRCAIRSGRVNYNLRDRDNAVESDPAAARVEIEQIRAWLTGGDLEDRPLEVESEISISKYQNICLPGSLHREIIYVINHTIHHIAYAKTIARQMQLPLDAQLGVAPATATYLRSTKP